MDFLASSEHMKISGRTMVLDGVRYLDYSGSFVEFVFTGKKVSATLWSNSHTMEDILKAWVAVFVDDQEEPVKRFPLEQEEAEYVLFESDVEKTVTLKLCKVSEEAFGKVGIKKITTDNERPLIPTKKKEHTIEFIGDSITCGYGIEGIFEVDIFNTTQENCYKAYAMRTAKALDADYHLVSWSGIGTTSAWVEETVNEPLNDWLMPMLYQYTDASLCRDLNMPADQWERWDFARFQPELIVINLGTNDASYVRNIPERMEAYEATYYKFLEQVRENNPASVILATLGAMGQDLCPAVERQVNKFASEKGDQKIHFMSFDVQLDEDGIGADWHPSEKTHVKMAERLTEKVKEIMNW